MVRQCDNCSRKSACVRDYTTSYTGDTQQCCRCTERESCEDCMDHCPGCDKFAYLDSTAYNVAICDECRADEVRLASGPQSAAEARGDA